ncbi:MAG: PAS domain S-box protein, partial [Flavobacteriaceae bacterium]
EYRYLKSDGTYAYVSDKAIIIRDKDDRPIRMIGAMQNITEEKILNDKLQQSEERFKGAFYYSSLGMAIVDLDGYWIEVNDRLCQILGYTKEEFKNLTFYGITFEEDLEEDLKNKQKIVKGEQPGFSMEKRYVHKNKSLIWVLLTVSLVRNSLGEIQHFVAQIIDISERKKMEEENRLLIEENNRNRAIQLNEVKNMYRLLADNIIDLVCLHSLDTTLQYVSPSVKNLLGYTPEELTGTLPENLVHPDDLGKLRKKIISIISSKGSFSEQLRLRHVDGEYSWFETNATLVYENGNPVSFQSSTRDITQRKKAEQIIEDTLIQERQLNELRTNLVSTISHEFRTPMTTIRTSAELITMYLEGSGYNFNSQIEKRVQTITKEIDRIVELMDAVLTISKDDAGKTNFNPVYCNLKEICIDVIETSYTHLKDNRTVEAIYDVDDAVIFADVNLIKYSLFNVLNNAFKYSQGSNKNVRLYLYNIDNKVVIEVVDFGIGIPDEDQSKLFNTFYRASNSNGIQGTGLGLYIIKMFTKKNSGKVKLESKLGEGTKVTLKFPLIIQ